MLPSQRNRFHGLHKKSINWFLYGWDNSLKPKCGQLYRNIYQRPQGSFIQYACKIFRKTNICCTLIRTRQCKYQWVKNVNFSENFGYVPHMTTYRVLNFFRSKGLHRLAYSALCNIVGRVKKKTANTVTANQSCIFFSLSII